MSSFAVSDVSREETLYRNFVSIVERNIKETFAKSQASQATLGTGTSAAPSTTTAATAL